MIFKVYNNSNSMVAVYSLSHSTYYKSFDAKVKSLHNAYTTDIHINKEQFGTLVVKFIFTASDLAKLHKLYTYQSSPAYRVVFLDPETDYEYNIHITSNFQQNRLGFKDAVSYFSFDLTADIIGLSAFPTYKTGDASFWTQWSEPWEVGPVATLTDLQSHPYYSNKFDLSKTGTPSANNKMYILTDSVTGNGNRKIYSERYSGYQYITYNLSTIKDYGTIRITLSDILNLSPSFGHRVYMILDCGDYNVYTANAQIIFSWMPDRVYYTGGFYDGPIGSAPVAVISGNQQYINNQNPVELWIEHSMGGLFKVKDYGYSDAGETFEWDSNNYVSKISRLRIGHYSWSDGLSKMSMGRLSFSPDSSHKVIIS